MRGGDGLLDLPRDRRGGGFRQLPRASEEEEDLLDLAAHVTRTSRLACQIELTDEMETLTCGCPAAVQNWLGR